MPRTISSALATEIAKTITTLGYLVQINGASILRWSNIGDFTYSGFPWIGVDFAVEGLKFDTAQDPTCTLKVQNLDNVTGAYFIAQKMADVSVDIYQFAAGALAAGDAPQLVTLAIDDIAIGLDRLEMKLVAQASMNAYSPRRRIDAVNGFSYAAPIGTQIPWGNDVFIIEQQQ